MTKENIIIPSDKKTIRDSNFFIRCQERTLLDHLIPPIQVLMGTEEFIDESFPRSAEDEEDTRIFIVYTNEKGSNLFLCVKDPLRLSRVLDIDTMLIGYNDHMIDAGFKFSGEEDVDLSLLIIWSFETFILTLIGIGENRFDENTKNAMAEFLSGVVSALYNDPLDFFINVKSDYHEKTDELNTRITSMYTVKTRE